MSGVNVQISMTNLTQVDRHQNDLHRMPGVFQEQNAQTAHEAAQKRVQMPIEADAVEKKKIDAKNQKQQGFKRKAKRAQQNGLPLRVAPPHNDPDHFVDVQA